MPPNRLITLAFSHYNEKARWALDVCGVSYREERWMPGFSQLAVLAATRGRGGKRDEVSSRLSTPVFLSSEGETLVDSTDIAKWASKRAPGGDDPLFPADRLREIDELVAHFGRHLGPHSRLAAYHYALPSKTVMRTLAEGNVGRAQALAFRALAPLGKQLIKRGLNVTEERSRRSIGRVREALALAEDRLATSAYLVGDVFTAADLTFASLLAPLLLVSRDEGYAATLPTLEEVGPEAAELVHEVRSSRAGSFALEMFKRHRRAL
ncbi:MAG: glutathione S-transferase N-terminal domain-containing protein [Polyangiaceae bacterium]